jgi:hypothetical protein
MSITMPANVVGISSGGAEPGGMNRDVLVPPPVTALVGGAGVDVAAAIEVVLEPDALTIGVDAVPEAAPDAAEPVDAVDDVVDVTAEDTLEDRFVSAVARSPSLEHPASATSATAVSTATNTGRHEWRRPRRGAAELLASVGQVSAGELVSMQAPMPQS